MHVCLFDIDGTLLNTGGAGQAAMEAALRSAFGITEPADGISYAGRTDRAIVTDLFDFHGLESSQESIIKFLEVYLEHLPRTLASKPGLVLPGVVPLLRELECREDVLLGLLTGNFERGAAAKLGHYGLDHHFRFGGFGDQHLHRDDVAREAMRTLQSHRDGTAVDLRKVWVIGDTVHDVRCARAIDARAVAVGTGFCPVEDLRAAEPDFLFESFAEPGVLISLLD